jgi:DNA-directed RNA polymerase subunit A"
LKNNLKLLRKQTMPEINMKDICEEYYTYGEVSYGKASFGKAEGNRVEVLISTKPPQNCDCEWDYTFILKNDSYTVKYDEDTETYINDEILKYDKDTDICYTNKIYIKVKDDLVSSRLFIGKLGRWKNSKGGELFKRIKYCKCDKVLSFLIEGKEHELKYNKKKDIYYNSEVTLKLIDENESCPNEKKRALTKREIEDLLNFIEPNLEIPEEISSAVVKNIKNSFIEQLKGITIYPSMLESFKEEIKKEYYDSIIEPGESVGVITAQSICEKQTQSNLNTFHKAGSCDKQPVVSKFSELLNTTNKPKVPSFNIFFKNKCDTVQKLRETISKDFIQLTLCKITKNYKICIDKEEESWYDAFYILEDVEKPSYELSDCISIQINMDILFEYKITLKQVSEMFHLKCPESFCIFSPDCFGQLDIFFDTTNIDLPEKIIGFVTEDNMKEIYLEEVVQPMIENLILFGIPGIMNMYFLREKQGNDSSTSSSISAWYIETENSNEKIKKPKYKKKAPKPIDSVRRYKQVLGQDVVDETRTISNNVWDIYYTLGIEAVREYMIEEFCKIMEGINTCHIMVLVDKMTFSGNISSVSRYTMRKEESVLGKASFEETLDNLMKSGIFGHEDNIKGVSASIICGKRANMGTGLCQVVMDMDKILEE